MVATVAASGSEATQTFLIENTNNEKIALQIEAFHREMDINGKETRKETDEFSVFPQQLVLEPGERRNVRLTWTGEKEPKAELAYRLVVSQLPVNLKKAEKKKAGANITFLLQYVASIYVTPGAAAAPKVTVESFEKLSDGKAEMVLKNSGTAHQVLKGVRVRFKSRRVDLAGSDLKALEAENILPGQARKFELSLPKAVAANASLSKDSIEVEFDSQ
jgi:fimbrial chaperone protein